MVNTKIKYLGNFSAVEPVHTRYMICYNCNVSWNGCWDNFMCPICGEGDIPSTSCGDLSLDIPQSLK